MLGGQLYPYRDNTGPDHVDMKGCFHGKVHHPPFGKRSTVVHFDNYLFSILLVGHQQQRAKRVRAVGSCQTVGVVFLTGRRAPTFEFIGII